MPHRIAFSLPVFLLVLFLPLIPTFAGEGLFSRAYTTETVPEGHFELEQLIRNRTGRAFGDYTAFDLRSEFEYGVTNNFQVAFYLNTGYVHANNAPDDNLDQGDQAPDANGRQLGFNQHGFALDSISFEFLYRVLSPITDPIGLAFYFEPEYGFHDIHNGAKEYNSSALEFRVLFQKNLLEDQLILVYNFVTELEYYRYGPRETAFIGELDWNNEFGATYRVASNWYAGAELRNHNEVGNYYHHDHSIFWAGPAIHYAGPKLWATVGVLKQFSGNPNGFDDKGSFQGENLFLHSHESWETTFKVGFPF